MALRVALSCVVFLLSLISFASMTTSQQCQYTVRVKTGDIIDAGTDSNISLKLQSSTTDSFTVSNLEDWGLMGAGYNYYEQGNLDVFGGQATCLNVCDINVISNGQGNKPGWFLDYVEVTTVTPDTGSTIELFPVSQWLAVDESPYLLNATVNLCL